jgi:hypothetical protein
MALDTVPLEPIHMMKFLEGAPQAFASMYVRENMAEAYFSPGSAAYCLLDDGKPVFAGGIVNQRWHRGEAWILPTPFFREHLKICLQVIKKMLPQVAAEKGFVRVQAVAAEGMPVSLFEHKNKKHKNSLGFSYEATLRHFGPHGETCRMYARFFESEKI